MRYSVDQPRRRKRSRGGNAILEFALGSGLLMAVFAGTFQFGYSFLLYNNLENAVARGARYAAVAPYDSPTSTPSAAFTAAVKNMVLYGSTTAGDTPVLVGLTPANVNFTVQFANNIPGTVTVSITGYTIDATFTSYTLTNKPQVTYIYQGVWAPI
jgi:Flp pilus assembly protein TadG